MTLAPQRLGIQQPVKIHLGELPPNSYTYYFTVINPMVNEYEFTVSIPDIVAASIPITGNQLQQSFHLSFTVDEPQRNKDIVLSFEHLQGENVFIRSSTGPQLNSGNPVKPGPAQTTLPIVNSIYLQDSAKRNELKDGYRAMDVYVRVFQELSARNNWTNTMPRNAMPDVFYEFISLEAAKKQLDYVIYEKLFSGTSGGFFKRLRRKVSRKFVTFSYRLLTRSERRKGYLAKLYRNYVNLNYLSERK
jgi:hypothetical protein